MPKDDSSNLLEPVAAVENYLDNLLQDEPVAEAPPVLERERKVVSLPGLRPLDELLAEPLAEAVQQPLPEPETVAETAAEALPDTVEQVVEASPAVEAAASEAADAGTSVEPAAEEAAQDDPRARYAFPVQCLMFRVDRHQLCIPLIDMGSVAPLDTARLTHLPDTPDWLLGVLPHREQNLRIVDSAVLLGIERREPMPERMHFLVFADEDFAITCDDLGEVVYLQDDAIKWLPPGRDSLTMGTVRETLAALLSPGGIVRHMQRISDAKYSASAADTADRTINEPNGTE